MKSTKRLVIILITLIICFVSYLFIYYTDETMKILNKFANIFKTEKIIIPDESYNVRKYKYQTVVTTNNFVPKNKEDLKSIYYTVLNNGWTKFTFYCEDNYPTCKDDVKELANDKKYLALINNYVNPYNTYNILNTKILNENEITIEIEKLYSNEEIKKTDEYIESIIQRLNINKDNVKLQDIKNIHNYLVEYITYDNEHDINDKTSSSIKATGALLEGKAVCSGYSDSFALFLDKLDIPNFKVTSETHVWNVLYFNNKWTHIDITWDDDESNKNNRQNFFMITSKELKDKNVEEHDYNTDLYLEIK